MNECQYRTIDVRGPGWGQGPGGTNDVGSSLKVDVSERRGKEQGSERKRRKELWGQGERDTGRKSR